MELKLEEAVDSFLNLEGKDDAESRKLLEDVLYKFMQETGNSYPGLGNIVYKLDNHICDLDEIYELIKDYCAANDIRCDALDAEEPKGWGSENDEE